MVGMKLLIKKYEVLIDEEFSYFSNIKWSIVKNNPNQVYFISYLNGKSISMHRVIMNNPKGLVVDHINGNTLDNRKENLRICSFVQNIYNQKKHKGKRHSKYKGVTFRKELKSKPWEAFIYANRKSKRLGYFATEIEAAKAYNEIALKTYGKFAKLNEFKE
jgi:hypothetical protein